MSKGNAIAFISTISIADTIVFAELDSNNVATGITIHKATETEKAIKRNNTLKPRKIFPEQNNDNVSIMVTNKQWRDMKNRIATLENN